MSCSIHYTCPKSQQCRRHGPGRARGRGHAVGDQAEEEGEEATEIGERDEDGDSDSDAAFDGCGDAVGVRGKLLMQKMKKEPKMKKENELLTCLY